MPVKGLMPGLMEVGKIKIGIKGKEVKSKEGDKTFRLPQKIDHFRIVKNERDENDDYVLDDQILNIIKDEGKGVYNKEDNLIKIPIRLLYNDIDLSFPTQHVSYVAGKLSCSGNGEKAKTRDGRETKCPCPRLNNEYTGKDKCKISGTLSCIIEGGNVGSCYKFRTTSINSARYILSSLMLIKAATGGLLSFIPLRLVINPKKTIIPATGAPTTIYVVTVEFEGGIDELQKKALEMGQERVNLIENMRDIEIEAHRIVSSDSDQEQEEKEFAEEFFPEEAVETKPETETETVKAEKEAPKDEKAETKEPDADKKNGGKAADTQKAEGPAAEKLNETETITRDQLKKVLALKNELKIIDQKAWTSLIKKMKFKDVTKANGMTTSQGDKFIEYLESLKTNPI